MTIVVSTPYMDEATRCDRVALIQRGTLLAIDPPDAVARSLGRPLFAIGAGTAAAPGSYRYQALLALRAHPHTHAVYPFGDALHYSDDRNLPADQIAGDLRAFLAARGLEGAAVSEIAPTVEDSFIERMGGVEEAAR